MQQRAETLRRDGRTIGFVPTMGFLHQGHLSLITEARRSADVVVVSIFVNPTQFGPNEDLNNYPRDLESDTRLAEKAGADLLFTPEEKDLYPEGFETYVIQTSLPEHLCGLSRPGHFKGVTTIVTKLLNIVKPHFAVFGQKDFQQLSIIRKMVRDLNFDTKIIGNPTIRESDGLAMSSRNKYLSHEQRKQASKLFSCLAEAQKRVSEGETDPQKLIGAALSIMESIPESTVDYIRICDPNTLEDISAIDGPALMAIAVKVGTTRLIDNMILIPPGHS